MIERFKGEGGRRLLLEALLTQRLVGGKEEIAEIIADKIKLSEIQQNEVIIEQNDEKNSIFFIISGSLDIIVNGRLIGARGSGNTVGEMAAIQATQTRSATVRATEKSIVGEMSEADFSEIAHKFPHIYKEIAKELAKRLSERNRHVSSTHSKLKVFLISSAEALPIARIIQLSFEHDFVTTLWTDGVFKVSHYAVESLEAAVADHDFGIAIAHADDFTTSRGVEWPAPRDNVIFELGIFLGRLGRKRAILMEPRDIDVKLPSDLTGITTIPYRYEKGADEKALLAPACQRLREHINDLGPNN